MCRQNWFVAAMFETSLTLFVSRFSKFARSINGLGLPRRFAMEGKPQMARSGGGKGGSRRRTAADLMDQKPEKHHMLPVWFFVGVILLIYGVLISLSGLYELSHPPATVLSNLHPAIWWGALLTVIGAIYVHLFKPRKA
jgi:hypothetical protein